MLQKSRTANKVLPKAGAKRLRLDISASFNIGSSIELLSWLPDHFLRHNCDLTKLEVLEITIWTDFDSARTPPGMSNCKEFVVHTLTKWKTHGREEQTIEISQTEIIKENFMKLRIPEFK